MSKQIQVSAAICVVSVLAGCVSRSQFDQVSADRDRTAVQLVVSRGQVQIGRENYQKLNEQFDSTRGQLAALQTKSADVQDKLMETQDLLTAAQGALDETRSSLSKTRSTLAAAQKDQAELVIVRRQLNDARRSTAQIEQKLTKTESDLAIAQADQRELKQVKVSLSQTTQDRDDLRQQLASAQARTEELTRQSTALDSQISHLRDEQVRQAADSAARLSKANTALGEAQKEHAELEQARHKLTDSQQAIGLAQTKLTESDKRIADLRSQLDLQSLQLKRLQDDARQASAQAE